MFGSRKKKSESFEDLQKARDLAKDLQKIRDLTKDMLGDVMHVYVVTMVGHLMGLGGRTAVDAEKAKTEMLTVLQKYVLSEILLDRRMHGREPSLAELVYLRP